MPFFHTVNTPNNHPTAMSFYIDYGEGNVQQVTEAQYNQAMGTTTASVDYGEGGYSYSPPPATGRPVVEYGEGGYTPAPGGNQNTSVSNSGGAAGSVNYNQGGGSTSYNQPGTNRPVQLSTGTTSVGGVQLPAPIRFDSSGAPVYDPRDPAYGQAEIAVRQAQIARLREVAAEYGITGTIVTSGDSRGGIFLNMVDASGNPAFIDITSRFADLPKPPVYENITVARSTTQVSNGYQNVQFTVQAPLQQSVTVTVNGQNIVVNPNSETARFIQWQASQPSPLGGGTIGDNWARQGIGDPYSNPEIIKAAQEQIQRSADLAAVRQNAGIAVPGVDQPWNDPNWPKYGGYSPEAYNNALRSTQDPAYARQLATENGWDAGTLASWQLRILDPAEYARRAAEFDRQNGFVVGPGPAPGGASNTNVTSLSPGGQTVVTTGNINNQGFTTATWQPTSQFGLTTSVPTNATGYSNYGTGAVGVPNSYTTAAATAAAALVFGGANTGNFFTVQSGGTTALINNRANGSVEIVFPDGTRRLAANSLVADVIISSYSGPATGTYGLSPDAIANFNNTTSQVDAAFQAQFQPGAVAQTTANTVVSAQQAAADAALAALDIDIIDTRAPRSQPADVDGEIDPFEQSRLEAEARANEDPTALSPADVDGEIDPFEQQRLEAEQQLNRAELSTEADTTVDTSQDPAADAIRQQSEEQDRAFDQQVNAGPDATQTQAGTGAANNQATLQARYKTPQTGDWRVRLQLAPQADYLYRADQPGILAPLYETDGVIFPYTPSIETSYAAGYDTYDLVHSNYRGYFYKGSRVNELQVRATFTAQDTQEANYLLAVIHFFRSVTKMFYGAKDEFRGAPPPLCYLSGYGPYQFNQHPVLVSQFQYSLPQDVDYIRARAPNNYGTNLYTQRPRTGTIASNPNTVGLTRLLGTLTKPPVGAVTTPPTPGAMSQNVNNLEKATYVPTKIEISITLLPFNNRSQVSQQFNLKDYASGSLIKGGFW